MLQLPWSSIEADNYKYIIHQSIMMISYNDQFNIIIISGLIDYLKNQINNCNIYYFRIQLEGEWKNKMYAIKFTPNSNGIHVAIHLNPSTRGGRVWMINHRN